MFYIALLLICLFVCMPFAVYLPICLLFIGLGSCLTFDSLVYSICSVTRSAEHRHVIISRYILYVYVLCTVNAVYLSKFSTHVNQRSSYL